MLKCGQHSPGSVKPVKGSNFQQDKAGLEASMSVPVSRLRQFRDEET